MKEAEFSAFFAEACARLGLRSEGYRRTRGSVRKRLTRRLRALGLAGLEEYRRWLDAQPDEWLWLDQCCRITISRFALTAPSTTRCCGTTCRSGRSQRGPAGVAS